MEMIQNQRFDLTGRQAKCSYCKKIEPSSYGLWFFEYLGDGCKDAQHKCGVCGFGDVTHMEMNPSTNRPGHMYAKHDFEPIGGQEFDRYYCACRGTD